MITRGAMMGMRMEGTVDPRPMRIFDALLSHFGPQHWWPGETPFEVSVGAILTQNTAWTNVEKAIGNLKARGILDPEGIHRVPLRELAMLVRPSGYYNQKAERVKLFVDHLIQEHGGSIETMLDGRRGLATIREELLSLKGIGPETADSILLYAGGHPTFVIDAYTVRFCSRYPLRPTQSGVDRYSSYDSHKVYFERNLRRDAALFNEYHAVLVMLGKLICRPKPKCPECPLKGSCRKKV